MQSPLPAGVAGMPFRMPLRMTRRVALVLPLVTAAACSSSTDPSSPSLEGARSASVEDEARLIVRYNSAITTFPQLQAQLGPILDEHRAHLSALGGAPDSGTAASGPAVEWSTPERAIAELANAEKAASVQRLDDCVAASDAQLARTLALIAASEAGHVASLLRS